MENHGKTARRGRTPGLLASGVGVLGIVISSMAVTTGSSEPAAAVSAPTASEGLLVHWDAAANSSLRDHLGGTIDDGDAVGTWVDLATGVTASAVTSIGSVNRPIYRATGGPNGTPVIEFAAGSSQGLETAPLALFSTPSSGLTVIAVFETDNVGSQNFLVMHDTGNCTTNVEIGLATGLNAVGNWGIHRGCSNADVTPGGTIATGTPLIVTTTLATTGATPNHVAHRVNGVSVANQTNASGFTPAGSYATTLGRVRLGFRQEAANPANSFFDGRVSEVMIFDRPLSTERIAEIEQSLASKVGIAAFPPAAPSPVTATAVDPISVTLAWTAPLDGGSAILGYDATVSAGAAPVGTCSVPGGTLTCSVGGIVAGAVHEVTLSARNALGTSPAATTSFLARFVPAAPGAVTVAQPDAATATLTWTAPSDGGSPILGYDATVSAGAVPVGTCSVPGGTLTCSVGGIVSGAIHDVTVSARNAVGASPAATVTFSAQVAPSPTVPPPPPTPSSGAPSSGPDEVITPEIGTEDPTPAIPSEPEPEADPAVPLGFVVAAENAVTVRISFVQLAPSAWRIDGDDFDLELVTHGPAGEVPEVDEMSIVTLDPGGIIESSGTGFAPDSRIEVWLFSEPRLLGTFPVDSRGDFRGSLEVPEDLVEGDHRLQVNGVTETGLRRSIGLGVRVRSVTPPSEAVTAPEGTDRLPVTGDGSLLPTGFIALVSLVLGLVAIARRRNLVRPN